MKKILQLLALILSTLLLFTGCQVTINLPATNNDIETATTTVLPTTNTDFMNFLIDSDSATKELAIGYTIYEPMNYLDDNGNLIGFDTEFAEAVCKKLNMTPKFVEINWDTKFVALDSDQIDCIWNGMTISDEVKTNCLVSKAYVKNTQVVVMSKDMISNYTTVDSLKGLKLTAEAGSQAEDAIYRSDLEKNYVPVVSAKDALMALEENLADACVIDVTEAKTSIGPGTKYAAYTYGIELVSEEYGIGFRMDDTELQNAVNKAIDELKADGTLTKLAEKYKLNLAF